jgi:hypothetical protein
LLGTSAANDSSTAQDQVITIDTKQFFSHFIFEIGAASSDGHAYTYSIAITKGIIRYGVPVDKVETNFTNSYININNLGEKYILGTLEANKKYSLIYNGEAFEVIPYTKTIQGSYVGICSDGYIGSYQEISLGVTPKMVTVYSNNNRYSATAVNGTNTFGANWSDTDGDLYHGVWYPTAGYTGRPDIQIIDGGFMVSGTSAYGFNSKSVGLYHYIATI